MSLQEKHRDTLNKLDHWTRIAADPDLSPAAALFARNAARSYRAAVTLGEKALACERQVNDRESRAALMRTLGIKPLV
jgi:uncharacterized membrane-anchored protein